MFKAITTNRIFIASDYSPWGLKESDMTEHACTCGRTFSNLKFIQYVLQSTQ